MCNYICTSLNIVYVHTCVRARGDGGVVCVGGGDGVISLCVCVCVCVFMCVRVCVCVSVLWWWARWGVYV